MSSVRDPVSKKQLAYERDHYKKGYHNDKRFRKAWPKIKRRMVRAGRHIAEEAVRRVGAEGDVVLPMRPKKKHRLHKRESPTLRQVVEAKSDRRVRSVGAKKERRARWQALVAAAKLELAAQKAKEAARSKKKRRRPNQPRQPAR